MALFGNESHSIDNLKHGFLRYGIAKPTRYAVEFVGSGGSGTSQEAVMRGLNSGSEYIFQPETVTLPSRSLSTVPEQFHGPNHNLPVGRIFESSLLMSFPVSETQRERSYFEAWMDSFIDPKTDIINGNYNTGRGRQFYSSIILYTLGHSNDGPHITSRYRFFEAFPSQILPTQYGFNMMNDYARLQVQFEYKTYTFDSMDYETKGGNQFTMS